MLDAVRRVRSISVMKTVLEKIYLQAIVGNQTEEDLVPEQKSGPELNRKKKLEPKKKPEEKGSGSSTPARMPESVKNFIENLRENPDEYLDLLFNTLTDYDLVSLLHTLRPQKGLVVRRVRGLEFDSHCR